jgi:UDP-GlcNAc:undecaprenyl-phosphate GlcNAc-1-phosphate transferase
MMLIDTEMLANMIFYPLGAFLLTLAAVPFARRFALSIGFVDKPGGRKQHEEPVPPIGGVVIFSIYALVAFLIGDTGFAGSWAFFAALFLIVAVGVIDDGRGVAAPVKFGIHFLAAFLIVVGGGAHLETLGDLLGIGELHLGWFAIPFSVACAVYIINAINMMDGLDGLAAGKSLIIFLWLLVSCALGGWWEPFALLAVLCAVIAGFLVYNMRHPLRKRACIFLGDAGSMALGLTIAWFCINLSQGDDPVVAPVSIAWIIALPIIDAFGLLVARLKDGKHPFEPDRRHFHHNVLAAGFTPGQATMLILGWGAVLGAIGYFGLALGVPEGVLGWLWVVLWLSHTGLTMYPAALVAFLTRLRRSVPRKAET